MQKTQSKKSEDPHNINSMSAPQKIEFEKRYEHTLKNMGKGKTWEEIEKKYVQQEK